MNVKELIAYLEDVDPELPVFVRADDRDYDYETLKRDKIIVDYVTHIDEDTLEDTDIKACIIGDIL